LELLDPIHNEEHEKRLVKECKFIQRIAKGRHRDSLFYNITKNMKLKEGCPACLMSSYYYNLKGNMKNIG
jgi:hypothetical protein